MLRSILWLIVVLALVGWLLGFFAFAAGGLIHILLVVFVIALILAIINGGPTTPVV